MVHFNSMDDDVMVK